jgi:hypothetical protein
MHHALHHLFCICTLLCQHLQVAGIVQHLLLQLIRKDAHGLVQKIPLQQKPGTVTRYWQ